MRACAFALLTILLTHSTPGRADETCPSFEAMGEPEEKLDHLAAVIRRGEAVDVLTVGTPGPAGPEGPPPPGSFSAEFAQALQAAAPGAKVRMAAIGGGGETAAEMLEALKASIAVRKPLIVLWQTGTVEAVKGLPPDEFAAALAEGAGRVADSGGDLLLVDPQFSRFLRANADVEPYEQVLREAAALPSVLLFRRYDLMHDWVDLGEIDLERVGKSDRQAAIRRLHVCLGRAAASFVLKAAGQPDSAPSLPAEVR